VNSIVFESEKSIAFEKTSYKNGRCKLTVKNKADGSAIMVYRYKDVPGIQSPYISWDNLNCCCGWPYDESYLHTAVQRGKKLFADVSFYIYFEDVRREQMKLHGRKLPGDIDVVAAIEKLQAELPGDCLLLQRMFDVMNPNGRSRYIDICKKGSIADYINLDEVFSMYERLGITMDRAIRDEITEYCTESIERLTEHFDYAHIIAPHRLIVAGLLLGYPVETTASLLEREGATHLN
jgi:hypothetical protein